MDGMQGDTALPLMLLIGSGIESPGIVLLTLGTHWVIWGYSIHVHKREMVGDFFFFPVGVCVWGGREEVSHMLAMPPTLFRSTDTLHLLGDKILASLWVVFVCRSDEMPPIPASLHRAKNSSNLVPTNISPPQVVSLTAVTLCNNSVSREESVMCWKSTNPLRGKWEIWFF